MSKTFDNLPHQTDEEIRKVVRLMLAEKFFGDWMCEHGMLVSVFLPLMFGALNGFDRDELGKIAIWEDLNEAGPRTINGYPMFLSMRIWRRDDMTKAVDLYKKAMEAQEVAINPGEGK